MENENIGQETRDISSYFESERKRKQRKKRINEKKSRVRRRNERILWTVILIVFLISLFRILPQVIKSHVQSPSIKTKKM